MKALFVVAVLFGFAVVFCQEDGAPSMNTVATIDALPASGELNSTCSKTEDCKGNGTRCDKITNTCQCMILLIPENGLCVNKTPISEETIWIVNNYVNLIIGLVVAVAALGSLFVPIHGRRIGERLFSGVRDKFRHSTGSHNPSGPYQETTLSGTATNTARSV